MPRVDEADAVGEATPIGLSGLHALKNTPFAFFPEDLIVPKSLGN